MSDPRKTDPGSLSPSSYDQCKARLTGRPDTGLASGPQDAVSGEIQETPAEPSERPTEVVEQTQKRSE
ncbi:MAG: hypothetical protein K2Y56_18095 [Methylobacterium sp.]|uniref:hypothetical protein n=1 Tax=Methylobacterium sp. TaxID=409 RepID=UPI0025D1F284|nr:hypothetical protein [Methylobacterium sp.]MBX9933418.1 hypothetical protein [Methylobacterium sp.]